MSLFISDTTLKYMKNKFTVLRYTLAKMAVASFFLTFTYSNWLTQVRILVSGLGIVTDVLNVRRLSLVSMLWMVPEM